MTMTDSHDTAIVEAPRATLEERRQLHPLVELATASGQHPDPEMLSKLMDLQERWEKGEARKAYARALVALKRDLPVVIAKDATVDFTNRKDIRTRYTHASLAGVMETVTEALTSHGFSLNWTPANSERSVSVTCRLTHSEGHHEEATLAAPADTSGSKNPAQAIASTVTLLSRYTALSLLGIATADMTEPTGEPARSPEAVNVARNMASVRAIVAAGLSRKDAEAHVGRPVAEWTGNDLSRLRVWYTERTAGGGPATGEEESGTDAA